VLILKGLLYSGMALKRGCLWLASLESVQFTGGISISDKEKAGALLPRSKRCEYLKATLLGRTESVEEKTWL